MRLIQARLPGIQLIEVGEQKIVSQEISYAIFSHRWGDGEISFQDVTAAASPEEVKKTKGYQKIKTFCDKVAPEYEYAWVDTCCINKESSAELSEAINSMYRWYQLAGRCYAYLNDVPFSDDSDDLHALFRASQWFERGWTLQELIAPQHITFLTDDWTEIGTKQSLSSLISRVTRIDEPILLGEAQISSVSVAKRMSWASRRQTTRIEDIAYCLMGIFDVNMPLLYGEGEKAFIRLQEEIMKDTDDQTIFAWEWSGDDSNFPGFLARSPSLFRHSGGFVPFNYSDETLPFELSNRGIRFSQFFIKSRQSDSILVLGCQDDVGPGNDSFIGVPLQRTSDQATYCRIHGGLHRHITWTKLHTATKMTIYAHKTPPSIDLCGDRTQPQASQTMTLKEGSKNIILLIDYKSQTTQEGNMFNVRHIHQLVRDTDICQSYYFDELCTDRDDALQVCVEKAYEWLVNVYEDRDRIFLFGYSGGALVVQAIAQILENVGVHAGCRHRDIWSRYQIWQSGMMGTRLPKQARTNSLPLDGTYMIRHCKPTTSVTFMGLFDAVDAGRVGQPIRAINLQWTAPMELPSEISHPARIIRHAISLDERDHRLQPIFVGKSMPKGTQSIEQVWFAGEHHHLGGLSPGSTGSPQQSSEDSLVSAHPLAWMIREACDAGLGVNPAILPAHLRDQKREDFPIIGVSEHLDISYFNVHILSTRIDLFRHISNQMPPNFYGTSSRPGSQLPVSLVTLVPHNTSLMEMLPSCVIDVPSRSLRILRPSQHWRSIPPGHKVHRSVVAYLMDRSGYLPRNLVPKWFVESEWEEYCNSDDQYVDL